MFVIIAYKLCFRICLYEGIETGLLGYAYSVNWLGEKT